MSEIVDFSSFNPNSFSNSIIRDLRSNHAGETGAVYIYKGILSVTIEQKLREFANHHLKMEQKHLLFFEQWLPKKHKSLFLPLWRVSGYLLGKIPAFFGSRRVYITINIVESFVTKHYQNQIDKLDDNIHDEYMLKFMLQKFQADEEHHRVDAYNHLAKPVTFIENCWQQAVAVGSKISVRIARFA